jgi:photosystem II stability/assembly factor-like uncharacterized protein
VEGFMHPGYRIVTLLITLPLLAVIAGQSIATEYAPIKPLASRSLLLDITAAGDRAVVAGERGHILYSDDNGTSWQQARVPTTQMLTGVYFIDHQRGWAVGHDGLILVSDDSGENWRTQRDGLAVQEQANLEMREQAHRKLKELESALESADEETRSELELQHEDAVMDLEDADLALEEPVFTSPLMDVWFLDQNRGWAVGAFGTLLTTDDGGQHWVGQPALLDNPDEFHLNTITGDGATRVFIAGEGGVMYRSLDGGDSWETLEPFYEGSWFGLVYSAQHDALLVFGLQGNLFRSSDFGDTWEAVPGDSKVALAGGSASGNGDIVLVGGVGTVLRSQDGGLSFKRDMMPDRLSLSSAMQSDGQLILIGQGGAKRLEDDN